jgi:hypothetical protein
MRILLASAISAALLAGCATYEGPGYGYSYGYAYDNPYYYDNGYYAYGYGPSYYYGPGFSGSFSYYDYDRDGHYHGSYGGYQRSYQGSVAQPRASVQSGTSSSTVRHRDRARGQNIARNERAGDRHRSSIRAEPRQQAKNNRHEPARVASAGRDTQEQREHGG